MSTAQNQTTSTVRPSAGIAAQVSNPATRRTGTAAAAVFTWNSTPTRLRGELGALYYPAHQIGDGLYIGFQGAGAYWSEAPVLGGSNVSLGPTLGGSQRVGDHGAALMAGIGMQAHFYGADYHTIGQGDGYQVLPQLDLVVVLPGAR